VRPIAEVDVDDRDEATTGGMLVPARQRVHDRGAQRVFARRPRAAATDRLLEGDAVEFDAAADGDIVDGNAGILAEQIVGALGDGDVLAHGGEDRLRRVVALGFGEPGEAELHVVGQDLEGADIEELCRLLDDAHVDVEGHRCMPHLRTVAFSRLRKMTLSTKRPMMMTVKSPAKTFAVSSSLRFSK